MAYYFNNQNDNFFVEDPFPPFDPTEIADPAEICMVQAMDFYPSNNNFINEDPTLTQISDNYDKFSAQQFPGGDIFEEKPVFYQLEVQSPVSDYGVFQYDDNNFPSNNVNLETNLPIRTRKMSTKSSNLSNFGSEKPYRPRRTKEQMNKMSEEEKKSYKKAQNCENAKKCVARKNEKKKELKEKIPELEVELDIKTGQNQELAQDLLTVYSCFDNNAPYGTAEQFHEMLQDQPDYIRPQLDNNCVMTLEENLRLATCHFDDVINQDKSKMNANTFASQKSRAKGVLELAELELQAGRLDFKILEQFHVGNALRDVKIQLGPLVGAVRWVAVPEDVYKIAMKLYGEPS